MKKLALKWIQEHIPNGFLLVSGGKVFMTDHYLEYEFKGWFSVIMWLNSFGHKQWIVSKYNNYEWINTYSGFFALPFKWECKRGGYESYDVVLKDNTKDQITYHSPYNF